MRSQQWSGWTRQRGFGLAETLMVGVVAMLLIGGAASLAWRAMNQSKTHGTVEQIIAVSGALMELYGVSGDYTGVTASVLVDKLPPSYMQRIDAPGSPTVTIATPFGLPVSIDPVQGNRAVQIATTVPLYACADLVMQLQGSFDTVEVGDASKRVVASPTVGRATPVTATNACKAQVGGGGGDTKPMGGSLPTPGPSGPAKLPRIYLIRA